MFATFPHFRANRHPLDGRSPWNIFELELHTNFFLVSYETPKSAWPPARRTVGIDSLARLQALLKHDRGVLLNVQIAVPPEESSADWTLDVLSAAWECSHPADRQAEMILYRTKSGREYLEHFPQEEIVHLEKVKQIYPFAPSTTGEH